MKTLLMFNDGDTVRFLSLDGDYSHFNDVNINAGEDQDMENRLSDLIYDPETGKEHVTFLDEPTKDWDIFISCGFLP